MCPQGVPYKEKKAIELSNLLWYKHINKKKRCRFEYATEYGLKENLNGKIT